MSIFKKLFVPNGQQELSALESWTVRWQSAIGTTYGSSIYYTKLEAEVFTSLEDAQTFKQALLDAFKLIKDKYREDSLTLKKN